jgi:hypothetical protein
MKVVQKDDSKADERAAAMAVLTAEMMAAKRVGETDG